MFKVLLVAADNTMTARRVVEAAVELAKMSDAKLNIVTAYKPQPVRTPDLPAEFLDANYLPPADSLLDELLWVAKKANVEAQVHAATGDPAEAIVKVATRIGADLIVVGNKGMRGTRRVLGSVPNSVAHKAPCSVLIVDTTSAA